MSNYSSNITHLIVKNEIVSFAITWMDLEIVMLSKVNKKNKDKYHMISYDITYMWTLKCDTNKYIYKT